MPTPADTSTILLLSLVSAAATPVVLVTATAILLSGFTAKYNHLSDQVRTLSAEFRQAGTSDARRESIRQQLCYFERRMGAMWLCSFLLTLALVGFVAMILEVIFVTKSHHLDLLGAASLIAGLVLMLLACAIELYEIYLSRLTAHEELADIVGK